MPTLAQLQAEPWWGREIVTPELDWLGHTICARTSRPRVAAGTKGDQYHLRGAHRSQEWILNSRYCTSRTYTVQSGLTGEQARHIAGFDFTPGSATAMIAQSRRLYAAMRSGALEPVREFYGNVDGDRVVDGWNNVANRAATSDSSHLWHWHLTIDRRRLRDRALMERILAIALGEDDDMAAEDVWTVPIVSPGLDLNEPAGEWLKQARLAARAASGDTAAMRPVLTQMAAEVTALRGVVQDLTTALVGSESPDAAAILAGVDERLATFRAQIEADTRDAVADLGEGGAAQVRADTD